MTFFQPVKKGVGEVWREAHVGQIETLDNPAAPARAREHAGEATGGGCGRRPSHRDYLVSSLAMLPVCVACESRMPLPVAAESLIVDDV